VIAMRPALLSPLALAALLAAGSARADSIDGNWCSENGLRLTIQGPNLLSPGGARLAGDYSRHGFGYVAPAGEPGGGGRVELVLQGENLVRAQASQGSIEPVRRRCGPPVS
jgi:hypothetical protein